MSLTDPEISKIFFYLGIPLDETWQSQLAYSHLSGLDGYVVTLVQSCLTNLDQLFGVLTGQTQQVAGLAKVGSIEFFEGANLREIRSQGSQFVRALSSMVNVGIVSDFFSSSSSFCMPMMFGG